MSVNELMNQVFPSMGVSEYLRSFRGRKVTESLSLAVRVSTRLEWEEWVGLPRLENGPEGEGVEEGKVKKEAWEWKIMISGRRIDRNGTSMMKIHLRWYLIWGRIMRPVFRVSISIRLPLIADGKKTTYILVLVGIPCIK